MIAAPAAAPVMLFTCSDTEFDSFYLDNQEFAPEISLGEDWFDIMYYPYGNARQNL